MIASNTYKLIFKDTGVQPLAGLSGLFLPFTRACPQALGESVVSIGVSAHDTA